MWVAFFIFTSMTINMDAILALADPGNTKRSREIFPPYVYLVNETDDQLVAQVVGARFTR